MTEIDWYAIGREYALKHEPEPGVPFIDSLNDAIWSLLPRDAALGGPEYPAIGRGVASVWVSPSIRSEG